MTKHLLYILFLCLPIMGISQSKEANNSYSSNELATAKKFIHDLADDELPLDIVLSKHVLVNEPTDELYDYLLESLLEIRINLLSRKLELIQYKNYAQLPRKELKDIDPEDLNTKQMYFLYYKDRLISSLYLAEGKIASFTLVSKGDNLAHFVTY